MCKTPTNKKNGGIKAISSHEKVREKFFQEEKAAQEELVRLREKRFPFAFYGTRERLSVSVHVNGQQVDVLVDSGAAENVIDETGFESLNPKTKLHTSSNRSLYSYNTQQGLEVLGEFVC